MSEFFPTFYRDQKRRVEVALEARLSDEESTPPRLAEAMRYSTLNGGKRLRGVLVLETARLGPDDHDPEAEAASAALEMIHAYSLVHDDLPAMDDDDYRRGQPACHRRFGEDVAILCGNALYARGLELLAELGDGDLPDGTAGALVRDALRLTGGRGLIGGQHDDFALSGEGVDEEQVRSVYRRKTGCLLALSLRTGGRLGGLPASSLERLEALGVRLGIAFQIRDDLLERESDFERIGKDVESDRRANQRTYPSVVGPPEARRRLEEHLEAGLKVLGSLEGPTDRLADLVHLIGQRDH